MARTRLRSRACSCTGAPQVGEPIYGVYEPAVCIIVQGAKQADHGRQVYCVTAPANTSSSPLMFLLSASSPRRARSGPYLCLRLDLDPAAIGALMLESDMQRAARELTGPGPGRQRERRPARRQRPPASPARHTARHPDPGAADRARDPLSASSRRAGVAPSDRSPLPKAVCSRSTAPSAGSSATSRAVPHRGAGGGSAHERLGASPPLQGGDRDEPAAVPEADSAAGGAAADPFARPPMRRAPGTASATTAPRSSAASIAACSARRPCATPSACAPSAVKSPLGTSVEKFAAHQRRGPERISRFGCRRIPDVRSLAANSGELRNWDARPRRL